VRGNPTFFLSAVELFCPFLAVLAFPLAIISLYSQLQSSVCLSKGFLFSPHFPDLIVFSPLSAKLDPFGLTFEPFEHLVFLLVLQKKHINWGGGKPGKTL